MTWMNKIALALSVLAASSAWTQDSLSLQQAIFTALEKNYDILIAEKQVEIAEKNNTWSEVGLYPTVTLQVGQNNLIQDNSNNPFTFTPGVILNQSFSPTLSANFNLFSGFQVKINKKRLEQLQAQSEGNSTVVIESLVADIMRTYYGALLQRERQELFAEVMANSRRRLQYAEIKNKYSASNTLDLMQLKNQYLTDSTNFLLQQLNYENSLRNLVLLMNNSEDSQGPFPVLTDSLEVPLELIDPEMAKRNLNSNNQNLKNQFLALELQQNAIELQKSFLYPTLSFQANVSPNFGRFQQLSGGMPGQPTSVNIPTLAYSGNFALRYSIYNNWKNQRAVEVAKLQAEISTYNVEKLRRTLETNLTNLLALYDIRNGLLSVSTQNLEYASKAYELAQKRFDLGAINSIDLTVLQTNYQNTLIQHYENLYNRLDTYLEIYRLTGKLQLEADAEGEGESETE